MKFISAFSCDCCNQDPFAQWRVDVMDEDPVVIPLCIVGAKSPRAILYAQALRRLSSFSFHKGNKYGAQLRVTCVCDSDAAARGQLKKALCGAQRRLPAADADLDAIAEHEDFDEVAVLEEFGDFLCSAVLVLEVTPDRSVEVVLRALNAGKHVLLEPWAPALLTASRWGGVDDPFRRLWEGLRGAEERAVCALVHPLAACARQFTAWLEQECGGSSKVGATTLLSATLLRPARPDPISSKALGAVGAEQIAWIRPLHIWLAGVKCDNVDIRDAHTCQAPRSLDVSPGPGDGQCSLVHEGAGAVVMWLEDGSSLPEDACEGSPLSCTRYSFIGPFSTATLSVHFGRSDGLPGTAVGSVVNDRSGAGSAANFKCDEIDALEDELHRFASHIVEVQNGSPVGTHAGSVALDECDRQTYARVLDALRINHDM